MSEKITVSGAIVSKNGVTLFTNTGQSQVFGSESWRTAAILDAVLVPLAKAQAEKGFGASIELDLAQFSLAKQIEAATGGQVKVEEKIENGVSKMALTTASGARIEDASAIEKLVDRTAVEGGTGLAKFIERFGRLKHKHTADELLKFVQKMDLPIADDGCIVVYKFLDKKGEGTYADKHTGRVVQKLGSRVSMPLQNIDQSRAMCSSGLHVCSNRYGSYGNTVFLAKVDPADVVAIPAQEEGKMRVSAYHLVALLDEASYTAAASRKSVLSIKSGNHLVANVIAGNHPAVLEEVVVGGSFANKPETATLTVTQVAQPVKESPLKPVREIAEAPRIDPKAVKDKLKAATTEVPSPAPAGSEPWQIAKVGDTVRIEGSDKLKDGDYLVDRVSNDGRASRVRVASEQFGSLGVNNTLVKRIVQTREERIGVPAPAPSSSPAPAKAPANSNAPLNYEQKLAKAKELKAQGMSLRAIEKELKMCRKALSAHLNAA